MRVKLIALTCTLLLTVPFVGVAGEMFSDQLWRADPTGISVGRASSGVAIDPGFKMAVAPNWLSHAPSSFYRLHGKWPETWAELEQDGLFTASLKSPDGYAIDPDDGVWNFLGDMQYEYRGADQLPLLITYASLDGGPYVVTDRVSAPSQTLEEFLTGLVKKDGMGSYQALLDEPARQRLVVMRSMLFFAAWMYVTNEGHPPASLNELLKSHYSPFTPGVLNPVTGKPLAGDGRPNDIIYQLLNEQAFKLELTDEQGATPWMFSG